MKRTLIAMAAGSLFGGIAHPVAGMSVVTYVRAGGPLNFFKA